MIYMLCLLQYRAGFDWFESCVYCSRHVISPSYTWVLELTLPMCSAALSQLSCLSWVMSQATMTPLTTHFNTQYELVKLLNHSQDALIP